MRLLRPKFQSVLQGKHSVLLRQLLLGVRLVQSLSAMYTIPTTLRSIASNPTSTPPLAPFPFAPSAGTGHADNLRLPLPLRSQRAMHDKNVGDSM